MAGTYSVDGKLPHESVLGEQLGCSRTVIREMSRLLTAKGMVNPVRHFGTAVRHHQHWNLLDPDVALLHAKKILGRQPAHIMVQRSMRRDVGRRVSAAAGDGRVVGVSRGNATGVRCVRGVVGGPVSSAELAVVSGSTIRVFGSASIDLR